LGSEPHQLGLGVDQGQHLHAKRALQGRVLVELVDHLARLRAALELDHHADPAPIGFVTQVRDRVDPILAHKLGDALDQRGFVDHVRQLGDHDPLPGGVHVLDVGDAAHDHAPFAFAIGGLDSVAADDDAAGRKVWPLVGKSGPWMNCINSSTPTSSTVS